MVDAMLKKSLPVANGLGECILWDSRGNRALWSEVPGRELQIFDPAAGSLEKIPVHEELCSFGLSSNPDRIICAFQNGIAMTDRRFEVLEWIYRLQDDDDIRLNDGRVDRQGRFWVGSMVDNDGNRPVGRHSGQLFSVDSKGVVKIHFDGIRISNSLCW